MSPERVLLIGSAGQLGMELLRRFAGAGEVVACDRRNLDIADSAAIRAIVQSVRPTVILNAAAYTNVDRAESEPEIARKINADAPAVLAGEAKLLGALFVHYSTDYVFDGTKDEPWVETDVPHPVNEYGASKLAGEKAVEEIGGKYLIFRTSWVYSPQGKNFLLTMLRLGREHRELKVVADQYGAPTSAYQIAGATHSIFTEISRGGYGETHEWAGLYHMTCSGSTTWYGFASEIFRRAQSYGTYDPPDLKPIHSSEFVSPAARPKYSVLCNQKLNRRFCVHLEGWEAALEQVMRRVL